MQPSKIGGEDKTLQTDKKTDTTIKNFGEDKTLKTDKQIDGTLQKLVVRIKRYKQTNRQTQDPWVKKRHVTNTGSD